MAKVTLTLPTVGELDTGAEPRVTTALKVLEEFLNGAKLESTDNIKAEGITEASLSSALKTKLGGSFVGLAVEEKTTNFEAEAGKLYKVTKAVTVTMPAATAGRTIGVIGNVSGGGVKLAAKAGKKFVGSFLVFGQETMELTENQEVIVEADGSNWWIIAGEPKRTEQYGAPVARAGSTVYELSASRMAHVLAYEGGAVIGNLEVGGVELGTPESVSRSNPLSFFLNPGETFKTPGAVGKGYKTQHRLL